MLTDDDKEWFVAQISASGDRMGASIAGYEQRIGARLEKFQATLIAEFRKWTLPVVHDPRVEAAAFRAMDLELEGLQED